MSGAIKVIDYTEACALAGSGNPKFSLGSSLLLEQAGRRYRPVLIIAGSCSCITWTALREAASLAASDFELLEGPACGAGQQCPDFSANAPPIRLGFVRFAGVNAIPTVHGIDKWSVAVWRR